MYIYIYIDMIRATVLQDSRDMGGSHHLGSTWDPLHVSCLLHNNYTTVVQETFLMYIYIHTCVYNNNDKNKKKINI
jgi:hypothetical protein